MTHKIFLALVVVTISVGCAQKDAYLLKGAAEIFNPGVISTGQDLAVTLSPDGSTIFFNRRVSSLSRDPKRSGSIWWSQKIGDGWAAPQMTSISGTYSTVDPMITPDGSKMYFMSTQPLQHESALAHSDLWVRDRTGKGFGDDQWGAPRHLGFGVNTSDAEDGAPSVSESGVLYFLSDRAGGHGSADIYRAVPDSDGFELPENLGPVVNSSAWDGHPFIAPDESYLLFSSDRENSGYGSCDIYVVKKTKAKWAPPRNLGPAVNTPQCDMLPYVHPTENILFFTRIEENGEQNIYFIDLTSHAPF